MTAVGRKTECMPRGSLVKNPPANSADAGLIPGLGRSLEKEVAILSSIPAWEILWTKEPGGLQSMGSQRIGHNLISEHPYNQNRARWKEEFASD